MTIGKDAYASFPMSHASLPMKEEVKKIEIFCIFPYECIFTYESAEIPMFSNFQKLAFFGLFSFFIFRLGSQ